VASVGAARVAREPGAAVAEPDAASTAASTPANTPAPAGPTLDDVARLTPESDYSAYTAPGVDAQVRNEALRKLFHSDPHFGQPDGLDVATDEVCEIALSPQARQRTIQTARALGLLDDDLVEQQRPDADPA
jgi:Protein of unknown function (DUF3306)